MRVLISLKAYFALSGYILHLKLKEYNKYITGT